MKPAMLSTILLFLFMQSIVLVHATICYTCNATNSETCEHKEEECPEGTECMTVSEEHIQQGVLYRSLKKRCALNLRCRVSYYSFSDFDLYIKVYVNCCKEDRCNFGGYEMPKYLTQNNGVACPSCHSYDTLEECNPTKSTVCWQKDDQCIKFRGTVVRPDGVEVNLTAQGCSSAATCLYDYSETVSTKVSYIEQYECYVPSGYPPLEKKSLY